MTRGILPGAALSAVAFFLSACDRGEEKKGAVRRSGDPNFVTSFDEKVMDRAVEEAKTTVDLFVAALKSGKEGLTGFAVKKGFPCPEGRVEFIWLTPVRMDGDEFAGNVGNTPVHAKHLKPGQTVRVRRDEVADWMYVDKGQLRGGYTIVALVKASPDRASFEKNINFKIDWSQYRFLDDR